MVMRVYFEKPRSTIGWDRLISGWRSGCPSECLLGTPVRSRVCNSRLRGIFNIPKNEQPEFSSECRSWG
jgi:hypothetical protein